MGIDGAVVAVVTLFLLAYVVPQITRRRAVYADAPIGDRYSEDLRIITGRTLRQEGGEHGKIFMTERTMSTPTRRSGTRGPDAAKMRAIARDRSRARARIAQRNAYQQRSLIGGAVIALVALGLWIAVGAASLAVGWAIAATAIGGIYLIGVGFLVSRWSALNAADEERIAKATKALGRATAKRGSRPASAVRKGTTRAPEAIEQGVVEKPAAFADSAGEERPTTSELVETERAEAEAVKAEAVETARPAPVVKEPARSQVRPATDSRRSAGEASRVVDEAAHPAAADVPAYTLKPTRRSVKPYVAPEAPTADVPFRPTQLGERLGEAPIEAAHAAPEMTGAEELRSDVLGGGSTLDALLDRRRA